MTYRLVIIAYLTAFSVCNAIEPVSTAAAASTVSPWVLAGASALGAGITSAFNWFSARKSEDFSERMANTAHQREVKDLRAANLNPILSAGGKGAPAPQGNQASGANMDLLASAMAHAQIQKTRQETDLIAVETDRARDDWQIDSSMMPERLMYRRALMQQTLENRQLTEAQRNQIIKQMSLLDSQIKLTQAQAESAAAQAYKDKVLKKPYEYADKLLQIAPSAKKVWESVKDLPETGLDWLNRQQEKNMRGR